MKLFFLATTVIMIILATSCACRAKGEIDCILDPADTVKAYKK